jgi:hypothetical protein
MTATHIPSLPSASTKSTLGCHPLGSIALQGHDLSCLMRTQNATFWYAAKSLQNNKLPPGSGNADVASPFIKRAVVTLDAGRWDDDHIDADEYSRTSLANL